MSKKKLQGCEKTLEGRAGNRAAEIADTAAVVTGLINFIIFEHPRLFRLLTNAAYGGRRVEMD
jgi:hypothetical protein